MSSSYTTNKLIEKPANGDYPNTWSTPVNNDWDIIDASLGGTTSINAGGYSGTATLTSTQYRPPNIVITGSPAGAVVLSLPSGVGGVWSVYNNTGGSYSVTFASAGGGTSVVLQQGYRTQVVCDGTNVSLANNVIGTVPIVNGGTGATTASTAINNLLPSQSGNAGYYLTTNGSTASWAAVSGGGGGGSGTVTSISTTGSVNGITLTGGPITTTGTITLGGTLTGVSLTSQVAGVLPVASGGTNLTSFTSGGVMYASSSSALTTGSGLIFDGYNLGIGGAPSAWLGSNNNGRVLQTGGAAFSGRTDNSDAYLSSNAYRDSSNWRYITANPASMYQLSQNTHLWYVAPTTAAPANTLSWTQAMYLDGNGNLVLNNGAALQWKNSSGTAVSMLTLDGSTPNNFLYGYNPSGSFVGAHAWYSGTTQSMFLTSGGTLTLGNSLSLQGGSSGFGIASGNNYQPIAFYIGTFGSTAAEKARIDTSGNLLVGYTSSNGSYLLQVNSQIFATSSTIATSDARYKENVETLSGALDVVNALRPVSFDWKEHPVHNFDRSTKTVGFLAQEVQQVLADKPYLNSVIKTNETKLPDESTEQFLGIAEGNLIAILTAAIKEQQSVIESLNARVAALEAKS